MSEQQDACLEIGCRNHTNSAQFHLDSLGCWEYFETYVQILMCRTHPISKHLKVRYDCWASPHNHHSFRRVEIGGTITSKLPSILWITLTTPFEALRLRPSLGMKMYNPLPPNLNTLVMPTAANNFTCTLFFLNRDHDWGAKWLGGGGKLGVRGICAKKNPVYMLKKALILLLFLDHLCHCTLYTVHCTLYQGNCKTWQH